MIEKNRLQIINSFHNDLKIIKELVYDNCNLDIQNPKLHSEGIEYGACSFELNQNLIQHRVSKITPTKIGQFVTLWKRNKNGKTAPFDISDNIDFIIITSRSGTNIGQFIFPKLVLAEKGIISQHKKEGKRGIRVYPPWDITTNKQAQKTQSWQTNYFVTIRENNKTDFDRTKQLLTKTDFVYINK